MSRVIKSFDELRVRKFPVDKKVRLMQMAKTENKSLNQFLYDKLIQLADSGEIVDVHYRYLQLQMETTDIIKENSQVLNEVKKLINYISGVDENGGV